MNNQQGDDEPLCELAAMQFAGGMTIEQLARLWERDGDWVEKAIRRTLLAQIPRWAGGMKAARSVTRADRSGESELVRRMQGVLEL